MARSFGRALAAASSAAFVSAILAAGLSPRSLPVTGEITCMRASLRVQRPAMNNPKLSYMAYPISLVLTVRPSRSDRMAASARISA